MTKKLRICNLYETGLGRNDGAPYYFTRTLRDMGHDCRHISPHEDPSKYGPFDFYLWADWGEDALTSMLPYSPVNMKGIGPSVYIASDTHLGYDYRFKKAKEFDFVFCNQLDAAEKFKEAGMNAEWLPHAVYPIAYPNKPVAIPTYDLGFVGFVTFEKRAEMLDRILRETKNYYYGQKLFEDAAQIFRRSKVVFNTAAVDDINMRCFEALATGSFLLTENVPTLNKIFENKKHLVSYENMGEAVEFFKYYRDNDEERKVIAKEGMDLVLSEHTYRNRAQTIIDKLEREGVL